jgi:GT2 family glycosyltransferase
MREAGYGDSNLPLSVVIPVYNGADTLARALASVQAQSPRQPAEVIVVDDGSKDDSAAVAEALGARVISHEANRGLSAARNSGVAAASHEWVALLDADDEWLPHHLGELWALRNGHVLVGGSSLNCRPDPRQDRIVGPLTQEPRVLTDAAPLLHPQNFITVSTTLVRRDSVLDVGGFTAHEGVVEDLDMWVRLLASGTAVLSPRVSIRYYVHDAQMSADHDRMRAGHRSIVAAYARRSSSADLALRREGVEAWDLLGDSVGSRAWADAGRQALRILSRPGRARGAFDVARWRLRARRATSRVTRRGDPSTVVAVRDRRLRDRVSGAAEPTEAIDLEGSLLRVAARLVLRPPGILVVDSRWMAILGHCLHARVVDARHDA